MTQLIYDHPSMREMDIENDMVVSVYGSVRIPTERERNKRTKGFGDLDPPNKRLMLLAQGKLDPKELDDVELKYGVPRCNDGKFSAKAAWQATQLPARVRNRIYKELYKRANAKMHSGLLGAVNTIVELATEPGVDDAVRMQAAKYLFERLQGKTPDHVVHHQEAPWEVLLSGVQRGPKPVHSERIDEQGELDGTTWEDLVANDEEQDGEQ